MASGRRPQADGIVRTARSAPTGRRGRPTERLELVPELGLAVGVDLGATNCRLVAADLTGRVLSQRVVPVRPELTVVRLSRWLSRQVDDLLADQSGRTGAIRATVIGVPGAVRPDGIQVGVAWNLPQIEGTKFGCRMSDALPGIVKLDNDVNTALYGELNYGAARDARTAVMITIGTGSGRPWR